MNIIAETSSFDICIIGAGVAGCAMAAYLADNGFHVAVVEKNLSELDRIVGELMQPGGVQQLTAMGLAHLLEGFDAQVVTGYALFLRDKNFAIQYPEGKMGRGFHNGKFVQNMRKYIASKPTVTLIEGTVTSLIDYNNEVKGINYLLKDSETEMKISAKLTVVSDGMFSTFRSTLSDSPKTISSYFLGLVLQDCALPFPNHGHVIAAEPAPVLCYPISATETRMLIDFPGTEAPRKSHALIAYLKEKIAVQMPIEIQPSFFKAIEEGKFKVMPNHLCPARPKLKLGVVLIGDSLNMRHPLTGGGMTVALTDVHHIGSLLIAAKEKLTMDTIYTIVKEFYEKRHEQNATVNILADALYGVMSNDDLKEACYDYLQQGGKQASVPLSLLSALNRDSDDLLKHFIAVAVYGAANMVLPSPTPANLKRSYRMVKDAVHILSPLILNERPGPFTKATFKIVEKIF